MNNKNNNYKRRMLKRIESLFLITRRLAVETDHERKLELILKGAKKISGADGGSMYIVRDDHIFFTNMLNDTLKLHLGGTSGKPVPFKKVPLQIGGEPNLSNVVACVVNIKTTLNIPDIQTSKDFDFSRARELDKQLGYSTTSLLTVPLKNSKHEVIGALQLINAKEGGGHKNIIPFSDEVERIVEMLALQASSTLENAQLTKELKILFESFVDVLATAIDDKSPYTGAHCTRVPEITMMLADVADQDKELFPKFAMSEDDKNELRLAALLHDCGKVTTPVHIQDKATKLETIFDRIELVDTRFEVLKRDAKIALLEQQMELIKQGKEDLAKDLQQKYEQQLDQIDEERAFLRTVNIGVEFMNEELKEKVNKIAAHKWVGPDGRTINLLSENEVHNLNITKGTLTDEEREIINYHIVSTIKMLESIPYPKHLQRIPEFAGGHHERMDGKGYPNGLTRDEMSLQARMIGIADIFEALTASDRPYKKGKTIFEALKILGYMKLDGHVDPDLFNLFIRNRIYETYALKYLKPDQIVEVDVSKIPGYDVTLETMEIGTSEAEEPKIAAKSEEETESDESKEEKESDNLPKAS